MSDDHPTERIVRLARAANPQEAYIWKDALASLGIESQVVGDMLGAGIGDVPGIRPEVWVHREDFERARAYLDAHRSSKSSPEIKVKKDGAEGS
jgi:ABC-type taurine transport system substrate-binding protein